MVNQKPQIDGEDRKYNGLMKKDQKTNIDLQNTSQFIDTLRLSNANPVGVRRCSGRVVSCSCFTNGTRRVTLLNNPVLNHE